MVLIFFLFFLSVFYLQDAFPAPRSPSLLHKKSNPSLSETSAILPPLAKGVLKNSKLKPISSSKTKCSKKQQRRVQKILISLKLDSLKKNPKLAISCLKNMAFSKQKSMRLRWKALTSMVKLSPKLAYPHLRRALLSPVWFMRNAGLISLEQYKPKEALSWANRFLYDPSLVVRTVAVNIIKKHGNRAFKERLKHALNAPQNFYKGKSLWIRHHIVSTLAQFATPDEIHFFSQLLNDQDQRLHTPAILALKSIDKQSKQIIVTSRSNRNQKSRSGSKEQDRKRDKEVLIR